MDVLMNTLICECVIFINLFFFIIRTRLIAYNKKHRQFGFGIGFSKTMPISFYIFLHISIRLYDTCDHIFRINSIRILAFRRVHVYLYRAGEHMETTALLRVSAQFPSIRPVFLFFSYTPIT